MLDKISYEVTKQCSNQYIITAFIGLIGSLIGITSSYFINRESNKFQKEKEELIFKRKKREDIYYLIHKIYNRLYENYTVSQLDSSDEKIKFKFEKSTDIITFQELDMIQALYFPELQGSIESFSEETDKFYKIIEEGLKLNIKIISYNESLQRFEIQFSDDKTEGEKAEKVSDQEIQDFNSKLDLGFEKIQDKFFDLQEKIESLKI